MTSAHSRHPATSRRSLLRTGIVGAAGLLTVAAGRPAVAHAGTDGEDPALRKPILVGANPGLQLFDTSGACTAYLSTWVVDWSTHGSGNAIVLWQPSGVRVVGDDQHLAMWVADYFVRYFPELEGLPWGPPTFQRAEVNVHLDLASGLRARGGDISVQMADVLDRRTFATDGFALAGIPHSLSLVLGPCAVVEAHVDGRALPGEIGLGGTPERPSSSAFLTDAEVWRR
jgi:hypothetical protein